MNTTPPLTTVTATTLRITHRQVVEAIPSGSVLIRLEPLTARVLLDELGITVIEDSAPPQAMAVTAGDFAAALIAVQDQLGATILKLFSAKVFLRAIGVTVMAAAPTETPTTPAALVLA